MDRPSSRPRMGRISYLNVLPIYHALESGAIPHDYELTYGPPAVLNTLMAEGKLAASSTSSIAYARHPEEFLLLPNLAIGSNGSVQSVLLLSRRPVEDLDGQRVLVSAETHTSATLLRILFKEYYRIEVSWFTGSATELVATGNPPEAFLAIGDEALRLRRHPAYPHVLDLGDAWTAWTGLPFIFGVWVASRKALERGELRHNPGSLLSGSRDWGLAHMDVILDVAEQNYTMSRQELRDYFAGLFYSLGEREQQGLRLFYERLAAWKVIPRAPKLHFLDPA